MGNVENRSSKFDLEPILWDFENRRNTCRKFIVIIIVFTITLEFLQVNIAAFSQLALIECTTDGDLEYFLDMASNLFFRSMSHHPAWYKKNFFFLLFLYFFFSFV